MPWWKWKRGMYGYTLEGDVDYEHIKSEAKDILEKAEKGAAWQGKWGSVHMPIVVNGQIVGELWEDVDLKELEVGAYWLGKWGRKVQLVKDGRVAGFIWLP